MKGYCSVVKCIIGVLIGALYSASVNADYVYKVEFVDAHGTQRFGLATKINDSQFLIESKLALWAKQMVVYDLSVKPVAKIIASPDIVDENFSVAVISAENISGSPASVAKESLKVGRNVFLTTLDDKVKNTVQEIKKVKSINVDMLYSHNALYKKGQWGAPLLNNCDELVGISLSESTFFTSYAEPESISYAVETSELKGFLDKNKVSYQEAKNVCLSEIEQAQLDAEKATKEAEEAKMAVEKAEAAREELKEDKEAAEKAANEAKANKETAEKTAIDAKAKKEAAEKQKLYLLISSIVVFLLELFHLVITGSL